MNIFIFLLLLLLFNDTYKGDGLPIIKYPTNVECINNDITLHIKEGMVKIADYIEFNSRLYVYDNISMFPGPTIIMKAGTICNLTIINDLNGDATCKYHSNKMHCPDTTNVHVHGLHISPQDRSDNMRVAITSGSKYQYTYHITPEHLMGSFFYHPHFHGSLTLQTLGGMHGALLMLPHESFELPNDLNIYNNENNTHILVLSHIALGESGNSSLPYGLMSYEKLSNSFPDQTLLPNATAQFDNIVVNGIYKPIIPININDTNIFRLFYTGTIRIVELEFIEEHQSVCQMKLIARDGIFQRTPYLDIQSIVLFQGSRADVAIRCNISGNFTLRSFPNERHTPILSSLNRHEQDMVLTLQVTNNDDISNNYYPFPTTEVKFPQYLQSLVDYKTNIGEKKVTNIQMAPVGSIAKEIQAINGKTFQGFESNNYFDILEVNQVYEYNLIPSPPPPPPLTETSVHPLHIHVNSFQLLEGFSDVLREFEFRDITPILANKIMKIRFATWDYTGEYLIHCHLGEHSDEGMVAIIKVIDSTDNMKKLSTSTMIVAMIIFIIYLSTIGTYFLRHKYCFNYNRNVHFPLEDHNDSNNN